MADLFDPAQASWTYRAQAADVLHATKLPIAADRFAAPVAATTGRCGSQSAAWWADAMRGQDFRTEDHLDTAAFNAALWRGLGSGSEPTIRDGRHLERDRIPLLASASHCPVELVIPVERR